SNESRHFGDVRRSIMRNGEVLRDELLPRQQAANSYCSKHAKFHLMSVRVPWNAGVTQADNEPVSLSISEHESLVGDFAVASKPLKGLTQRLRRCHDVIKQSDFARIVIAC